MLLFQGRPVRESALVNVQDVKMHAASCQDHAGSMQHQAFCQAGNVKMHAASCQNHAGNLKIHAASLKQCQN